MIRRPVLAVVALGLVAGALAMPAQAKPKTITETYTTAPLVPDPTPFAAGTDCVPTIAQASDRHPFTAPDSGTLKMEIMSQSVDYSLAVYDSKGRMLACADGATPEVQEKLTVKLKTKGKYTLVANNFAGTPTATIKYTYTYGK